MPHVLAIVSKAVFSREQALQPGQTYQTSVYSSRNKRLDCLKQGGRLFLVTVRPNDVLWLVAHFENPELTDEGWCGTNTTQVLDISHLVSQLELQTGKGITAKPGRLAMSLQTPRVLSEKDSILLCSAPEHDSSSAMSDGIAIQAEGSVPQSPPSGSLAPSKRTPPSSQIDLILQGELERATQRMISLTAEGDGSEIDTLIDWVTEESTRLWRSFAAKDFWFHLFFQVLLYSEAQHLDALGKPPNPDSNQVINDLSSQMDHWVVRNRARVRQWIGYRISMNRNDDFPEEAFPKKKAEVAAYIAKRIGNPRWKESKALTEIIKKGRFALASEEGLHVLAALLIHAEISDLEELRDKARKKPLLAKILQARGIAVKTNNDGAALMDLVFAKPQDDDARWVLSDWLMEQDDPWGGFIRDQLSGQTTKPTNKDRKRYANELCPHIKWKGEHLDHGEVPAKFTRGLLHACAITDFEKGSELARGWSAIEIMDVTKSIDRINEYTLPSLRFIGGVQAKELDLLLSSSLASQLIGLGLSRVLKADQDKVWDQLSKFPNLRFLHVGTRAYDESLFEHRLVQRMETLWIGTRNHPPHPKCCPGGNWGGLWIPSYNALMRRWRKA